MQRIFASMYRKPLNRMALISLPILVFFNMAPIFMLMQVDVTFNGIVSGFAFALLGIAFVWSVNIFIILYFETRVINKKWLEYLISYFHIIGQMLLVIVFLLPHNKGMYYLAFYCINTIALNTAILVIANSVISQYKKVQLDKELTNLKIKNLEAEQQQLVQQLQPHFLFNALSTLKSLIKTDTELAEEYLVKLSDFLRFTVSSHKNKIVPLTEELQFTRDYIDLQRIRFSNSFLCSIDIPDKEVTKYEIPIYALQTLVENAIKHNAFTEDTPLQLKIVFENGYLRVTNNKIPKLVANKSGTGLQNLSKRYELLREDDLKIDETANTFMVTIKLIQKK